MTDLNYYAIFSLMIKLVGLGVILFYIIPKQFSEVMRPKSWLTGLRWQILFLFIFSIVSAIPSLTLLVLRSVGVDTNQLEILRNIASISGNISDLGVTILLVLIYNYKKRD